MELTRSFSADQFARALESWDWAGIGDKQPRFTSPCIARSGTCRPEAL
jgi:hypothetical protein